MCSPGHPAAQCLPKVWANTGDQRDGDGASFRYRVTQARPILLPPELLSSRGGAPFTLAHRICLLFVRARGYLPTRPPICHCTGDPGRAQVEVKLGTLPCGRWTASLGLLLPESQSSSVPLQPHEHQCEGDQISTGRWTTDSMPCVSW